MQEDEGAPAWYAPLKHSGTVRYGEGSKDTVTEVCETCHNRPSAAVARSKITQAERATMKNKGIRRTPLPQKKRVTKP
jgi:hypothetical protein